MKTWKQSLFEGTLISLFSYFILHRIVTGSVDVINWISGLYGYILVSNSYEVYTFIGALGIFLSLIITGIIFISKKKEINILHFASAFIGMIIYAGYIASITIS